MNATATPAPPELAPEALAAAPDAWRLIDVRTPGEFAAAHLPGSRNLPLGDLDSVASALASEQDERPVAIICRSGQRAESARGVLLAAGCADARVLTGGLLAWEGRGLPVDRGEGGMSLERQVRIAAGSLVVLGVGLGVGLHPGFLALSAFVGAGLVFAGLTDTCGMAMLLARMPWNRR